MQSLVYLPVGKTHPYGIVGLQSLSTFDLAYTPLL